MGFVKSLSVAFSDVFVQVIKESGPTEVGTRGIDILRDHQRVQRLSVVTSKSVPHFVLVFGSTKALFCLLALESLEFFRIYLQIREL
mmetsp:Transcript_39154/g.42456  ORF Transcript_39154/g.42456 Transcript_39154/m.42456 type:complete len:87 (-) Transcript_39154:77-337(-)